MATNRTICRICGQHLRWEVLVYGDHEGSAFTTNYFGIESGSDECRTIAGQSTSHLAKTPEAVKSFAKYVKWLDKQLQEEEADWENNVPDRE